MSDPKLKIVITADGRQYAAEIDRVTGETKQLGRQSKVTAAQVNQLSGALKLLIGGAAGAGVAKLFRDIVATGASFEQQMANVASVAGASGDALERLASAARTMAAESIFSATEVAQAQYFLASAGLETNQIIEAQAGIMALAAATQADLATTSDIVTSSLSQFSLEAAASERIANLYAAAISGSQANILKLGDAMRYIGPVANTLGEDIESTTAAVSLLFNAGFRGEQAGTALRGALVSLSNPSKEAAKLIDALGLTITDTSGKFVGFERLLRQLEEAQIDLADATTLFGTEAAPAMLALIGQGADTFVSFRDQITGTTAAITMSQQQLDTLQGDWKRFLSTIEEVSLKIFDRLQPALRGTIQTMDEAVPVLDDVAVGMVALLGARTLGPVLNSIGAASASAAASMIAMSAAERQFAAGATLAITQARALSLATAGLKGTLALLGGPAGIAILAGSAIAWFATRADEAVANTEALRGKVDALATTWQRLTGARLQAAELDVSADLDALEQERATAAARLETLNMQARFAKDLEQHNEETIRARAELERIDAKIVEREKTLADIRAKMAGIQPPDDRDGGGVDTGAPGETTPSGSGDPGKIAERAKMLEESLRRQIALYGETSATASVYYETTLGALAKLDPAQKQRLLDLAKEADANKKLTDELDRAAAEMDAMVAAVDRMEKSDADLIQRLEEELRLRQMGDRQRAIEINLRQLSAAATDEERRRVIELTGALYDLEQSGTDGFSALEDAVRGFGDQLRDAIVDGVMEGKLALDDLLEYAIRTFIEIQVQSAIIDPLVSASSSFDWGAFFASMFSFGTAHTGGVIGGDTLATKYVHPAVFADAPRFHTGGLVGGEVPIIAKEGEGVFTPEQMRALAPVERVQQVIAKTSGEQTTPVKINIINNAAGTEVRQQTRQGAGGLELDVIIDQVESELIRRTMMGGGLTPLMRNGGGAY